MSDHEQPKHKLKLVRQGLIWLVKPTLWRNSWNIDKELYADSPAGMQLNDLKKTHLAIRETAFQENALKMQLMAKLDNMSDEDAFEYYVQNEKLSTRYLNHRRKSLKYKGFTAYLLTLVMLTVAMNLPGMTGILSFIGKFLPFLLSIAFFAHGLNSFYRAEQIRQRSMFHFFRMFDDPKRLFM